MHFDPKTARGSVDRGRCLRARFRDMGEVCTLVLFIVLVLGSYVRVDVRSPNFNYLVHKLKCLPQTKSTYKVYENVNLYSAYGR